MHILRGILILLCFLQTGELLGDEGMPSGWVGGGVGTSLGFQELTQKTCFQKYSFKQVRVIRPATRSTLLIEHTGKQLLLQMHAPTALHFS
jgi:hypothetical protein